MCHAPINSMHCCITEEGVLGQIIAKPNEKDIKSNDVKGHKLEHICNPHTLTILPP